jgi:PPOX class probable F420-dependent enzyme
MLRAGQGRDLTPDAHCGSTVGGILEDAGNGESYLLGRTRVRSEHPGHPEIGATVGVARLIGSHGEQDGRKPEGKGSDDAAGSGMGQDQVAVGQHDRLRKKPLDPHMWRLVSELGRITLPTDRDDDVEWQRPQAREGAGEQVARFLMEHGSKGEIHSRSLVIGAADHEGSIAVSGIALERRRPQVMGGRGQGVGWVPEARGDRHQREVPVQHLELRIRPEAVVGSQCRQRSGDQVRAHHPPSGKNDYGGVRDTQGLGCHRGTEVHLVAHHRVRPPMGRELTEPSRPFSRHAPGKTDADYSFLPSPIDRHERSPISRMEQGRSSALEGGKTCRLHGGDHGGLTGERDLVVSPRHRPRHRQRREEVASPSGEGEQETHVTMMQPSVPPHDRGRQRSGHPSADHSMVTSARGLDGRTAMNELDRARYISLTTFKRDGSPVSSPVWITGADGTYVFTTGATAWKTKRLSRNPSVEARVCTMRGQVKPSATRYVGTGSVAGSPDAVAAAEGALAVKYGWQFKATKLVDGITKRLGRDTGREPVAIQLSLHAG